MRHIGTHTSMHTPDLDSDQGPDGHSTGTRWGLDGDSHQQQTNRKCFCETYNIKLDPTCRNFLLSLQLLDPVTGWYKQWTSFCNDLALHHGSSPHELNMRLNTAHGSLMGRLQAVPAYAVLL